MSLQGANIIQIVTNEHDPIFAEPIELLSDSLQQLGLSVQRSTNRLREDRLNVLVGHTAFLRKEDYAAFMDSGHPYVVFQVEALDEQHGFLQRFPAYMEFLGSARQIWDYSPTNVSFLTKRGYDNVQYVPLGHSSRLERIPHADAKDIDVLFYGAIIPRRIRIFQRLEQHGVQLQVMFNAYGSERDEAIARPKIVLNIHQFETSQLEQIRISYLLNNRCFVISETADCNPYGDGVVFCDYEEIAQRCVSYLQPDKEEQRHRIADAAHANLKGVPMVESLRSALGGLSMAGDR